MRASKKKEFFDGRDKYLSFVNSTNEKSRIAFKISSYLKYSKIQDKAFRILDAGTGEGTIISTFLCAVHQKFPEEPISVIGKEISIDDINNLLSFLGDRFYEHKNLIFSITNASYEDIQKQDNHNIKFINKELSGNTSFEFAKQLMSMSKMIKKNWELTNMPGSNRLIPKQKIILNIYRKDQKRACSHLIPKKITDLPNNFDLIIASQAFRLRSSYDRTFKILIRPLLSMLAKNGQTFLIFASGIDFSTKILKHYFPKLKPYQFSNPEKFSELIKKSYKSISIKKTSLKYGFVNLSLNHDKGFSLMSLVGLWNAVTYVGQIADSEMSKLQLNKAFFNKLEMICKNSKLEFKNHFLRIVKK